MHGATKADHRIPEVCVIFLERELISLSEPESAVHQFLVTQNPTDLEEFPVGQLMKTGILTC